MPALIIHGQGSTEFADESSHGAEVDYLGSDKPLGNFFVGQGLGHLVPPCGLILPYIARGDLENQLQVDHLAGGYKNSSSGVRKKRALFIVATGTEECKQESLEAGGGRNHNFPARSAPSAGKTLEKG